MAIKIAVANQKGGIGKTTTALAIADLLMLKGRKVLFVDTDSQRNSTTVYGAETEGIATLYDIVTDDLPASKCIQKTQFGDIIPSDALLKTADTTIKQGPKMYKHLKKSLASVEGDYDYIILDTPPVTGVMLGNALEAAEYVIIPTTCDLFGIQGVSDFFITLDEYLEDNEDLKILGILKIKYKGTQNLTKDLEANILDTYKESHNAPTFNTVIREGVKVQEAQAMNVRLSKYALNSTPARDYDRLVDEIISMVE